MRKRTRVQKTPHFPFRLKATVPCARIYGACFQTACPPGCLRGVHPAQNDRLGRNLERLSERFLRFVVLVAVAFVELVGALADYVRTDGHALASVFAGPVLGSS